MFFQTQPGEAAMPDVAVQMEQERLGETFCQCIDMHSADHLLTWIFSSGVKQTTLEKMQVHGSTEMSTKPSIETELAFLPSVLIDRGLRGRWHQ